MATPLKFHYQTIDKMSIPGSKILILLLTSVGLICTAYMISKRMKTNDHPKNPAQVPVIRPAAQAGRFYESDPILLSQEIDSLLARHAKTAVEDHLAALIVPHAGHYFSGNVAACAYMTINPEKAYKRIFLIGPSHYEWLHGASVNTEADYYATPLGSVPVDHETACQLEEADSVFRYREQAHDREHCLEVQLPFLQRRFGNNMPPIVPIIISTNNYLQLQRIAEVLKPYFNDDNLFIISSDFSHYPSYKDAYKVDALTAEAIMSGDVAQFIATLESNNKKGIRNLDTSACGEFPIITLMLLLNKNDEIKHLLYQNSGDIDHHDPSRVVGYHAFAILRKTGTKTSSETFSLTEEEKGLLKQLARESILSAFDSTVVTCAAQCRQHPALLQPCGAFVTLTKQGQLRGCIGHFGEDAPLYEMVSEMAKSAAFEDPRFPELRPDELNQLGIEISVLTPMRRIHSIDEFHLHRHGIYIRKGYRSGTFLPQVADEVNWTKEEFLGHCSRDKAGLGWDGWRDAELFVYEAIVF